MEFIINAIEENDYEQFVDWWTYMKFPVLTKNLLPNQGLGGLKLTNKEGIDVAAGFLYDTNSDISWLEYVTLNPSIKDKGIRKFLKKEIIYYLTLHAEQKGYKAVFSSVKIEALRDSFTENGYIMSKQNTKEMVINLNTQES